MAFGACCASACTLLVPLDDASGGAQSRPYQGDSAASGSGGAQTDAAESSASGGASGVGGTGGVGGGGTGGSSGTGGGAGTGGAPALYGAISTVSFSTLFIMDQDQFGIETYMTDHQQDALQTTAAFVGTYTQQAKVIPPAGAQATFAYALHMVDSSSSTAVIMVVQQSQDATDILSPLVMLQFGTDAITTGTVMLPGEALFAVVESTQGSVDCVAAVGFGALQITTALNTTAVDGGSLAFDGADVKLHHPSSTPNGDISAAFESWGGACPVQ